MTSHLSRIVLMVRGAEGIVSAVNFYHKAIGLQVYRVTDTWAELSTCTNNHTNLTNHESDGIILNLQAVTNTNEAQLCIGYSPWLTFTVSQMDDRIATCIQMGATLDGPIQYPAHGKIALLRSPDHHMIGLYEPAAAMYQTKS